MIYTISSVLQVNSARHLQKSTCSSDIPVGIQNGEPCPLTSAGQSSRLQKTCYSPNTWCLNYGEKKTCKVMDINNTVQQWKSIPIINLSKLSWSFHERYVTILTYYSTSYCWLFQLALYEVNPQFSSSYVWSMEWNFLEWYWSFWFSPKVTEYTIRPPSQKPV